MGAGNVKAVYAHWAHLPGKPFQLLAYMAVRTTDGPEPRWWGHREELAIGLGYIMSDLDAAERRAADRAICRHIAALTDSGALTYAVLPAPGRRAEYNLTVDTAAAEQEKAKAKARADRTTENVDRSSDDSQSNARRKTSATHDGLGRNARRFSDERTTETVVPEEEQDGLGLNTGISREVRTAVTVARAGEVATNPETDAASNATSDDADDADAGPAPPPPQLRVVTNPRPPTAAPGTNQPALWPALVREAPPTMSTAEQAKAEIREILRGHRRAPLSRYDVRPPQPPPPADTREGKAS